MGIGSIFNFIRHNLAMDLGTANTLIYSPKNGIVLNEPSVVAIDIQKNKIAAVGKEAKTYLGRTPERIRALRPLKDGVIADFEVTKTMISSFIYQVLKGRKLFKPKIIICVPTGITQVEKKAVIESAKMAGIYDVNLIEEPLAAALGAYLPIDEPMGNMIVDIGGGTTEVAIISLSSVAYAESVRIAGDEMDEAIQRYIQDEFKLLIGINIAEKIKFKIGSAYPDNENRTVKVAGKNMVSGLPQTIDLTSGHIRESIKEPVNAIVMAIIKALEKPPPELVTDIANNGLILTGGGALLHGLDRLITEKTKINVIVEEDPLTTVLRGTGRALQNRKEFQHYFLS